jgi:hypothetical protein
MKRRWAALPLAALLSAGCGTTVSQSTLTATGTGSKSAGLNATGLEASSTQPAGNSGLSVPAQLGGNPTGAAGNAATSTGAAGTSGQQPGPSATAPLINGPGVTSTTITIGVSYYQSGAAANAALGAKGVNTGDPVAGTKILLDAINKTGGIAGRRVKALFYAVDPQSSTPYATEAQAECTYFTEDHAVFAVIDGTPAADARACLAKRGVAALRGPILTAKLTGNEIDPYSSLLGRAFSALVPSLSRQGWFGPWNRVTASAGTTRAKIGIVTADDIDDNRAVDGILIPALRRAGYAPAPSDVIRITPPGGFSDDGATVAAIDNAALKLNADGVDHVILTDGNGSLTLLFNNYAYSQHYFPRHGGTSGNAWQVLLSAGDIQAKTLQGAIGIGWQPLFDLPYQHGDGPYSNAARHRCFALFTAAGMPPTDDGTAGGDADGCDLVFLLADALRGVTGPVNISVLMQRVSALGSSYPLASGLGSRFGPDQRDGSGAYAAMQFSAGCTCVRYAGSIEAMPS